MANSCIQPLSTLAGGVLDEWASMTEMLDLNPSVAPGWIEVAARSIGMGGEVLVYLEFGTDGSLSAVVPFVIRDVRMTGVPVTALQLASNLVGYHVELVVRGDHEGVLGRLLRAAPKWDVFKAAGVPVAGPTAAAILATATELRVPLQVLPEDESPYISVEGTWSEFLASKGKKFRYKLRRRTEHLESRADLVLSWFESSQHVDLLLSDMMAVEQRSWKAKSGLAISSNALETEYHRQLLPFLAQEGNLLACVLYRDDVPVAYSLCCHCNGWIGQLKTSFDESCGEWSPGGMVIDACIRKAFELGAREFDFLGQVAEHKLAWTSLTRAHAGYFLFAPRIGPRMLGLVKNLKATAAGKVQALSAGR